MKRLQIVTVSLLLYAAGNDVLLTYGTPKVVLMTYGLAAFGLFAALLCVLTKHTR